MERYTEKAKEALILAAEAAEETGSRTVGTEHILVGLMKEGTGTAARVLEAGDVKLERVLELEKKLVSSSQPTQIRDREGYTPIARKVLENSYREAVRFHAPLIGTEHILMAMLKQTDCVAVRLLNTLNINIQRLYIDLLSAMGEEGAAGREELVQGRSGRDGKADTPVLDEYGYEGGMLQQHKMGVIMAGELSAAKARLKLMLILSQYGPDGRPDPAEVARYFEHSM